VTPGEGKKKKQKENEQKERRGGAGAIGAVMINWCGSFAIAGCCNFFGFESRVCYKKERGLHGV